MYCLSVEAQFLALSKVMKLPRFNHVASLATKQTLGTVKHLHATQSGHAATSCSSHIESDTDHEEASIQSVQLPRTYTTVVYLLHAHSFSLCL